MRILGAGRRSRPRPWPRRQPVSHGVTADAGAGRRRRSGAGDISQGVSRGRSVRARDEPEGLVVHHPPQHGAKPRARSRARRGHLRQRDRRTRGRRAAGSAPAGPSRPPKRCCCARRSTRICRRRSTPCPTRSAQAVWLRDVEEFSYAEIADMLAIPAGTVMSRISRGRRMLFDRAPPSEARHV